MKKIIIGVCVAVFGLIAVGLFFANRDADNREYELSIVNTSPDVATVSVSLTEQKFVVNPNSSQTFKVQGQKDSDAATPRKITIQAGAINETIESKVLYSNTLALDVTGTSCIVAADYGRQYRGPDVQLPEGEADIQISRVFKGERAFDIPPFKAADGGYNVSAATKLGEKLPEKIEARNGVMPTHGRIIQVPCDLLENDAALYDYLNVN